jgi:site-specific DNA recombinase
MPPEERSAKHPGRPIFNDMLERIKSGEARYIAVWQASRLSRNPVDAGMIIYLMDIGKLLAIYTPKRVYRNTSGDKAELGHELIYAKKNNDDLSDQVKESFVDKRDLGEYPGPAPIGYKNVIVRPGKRNIAPDNESAPKILALFQFAATGCYKVDNVWHYAHKIGLRSRTGKMLGKQTVIEILKRKTYTGVFQYGSKEWHKAENHTLP